MLMYLCFFFIFGKKLSRAYVFVYITCRIEIKFYLLTLKWFNGILNNFSVVLNSNKSQMLCVWWGRGNYHSCDHMVVEFICTIYARLNTCLKSIPKFILQDKATLRVLKLYFIYTGRFNKGWYQILLPPKMVFGTSSF